MSEAQKIINNIMLKAIVNLQHISPWADVSDEEREAHYMMLCQDIDALRQAMELCK